MWVGLPIALVYLASRVADSPEPSMGPYLLILIGLPVGMVIIGKALGVEIDAYAILGFDGFRKLVNNVGGLQVYIPVKLHDPVYSMTPATTA